jgi:hypothetical protein
MRSFLAGIFLAIFCAPVALGQATGFVEKIGFGKAYRPYGWTPMLVNLTSTIGDPAEYEIQVRQEDLDRDRVIFRRDIVLNPNKQEQFGVYFMAQPRGFDDATPASLNKLLDVRLCTKSGKPLVQLKIQDQLQTLDPPRQAFQQVRGQQLILMVTDGTGAGSTPAMREYAGAIGLSEDIHHVPVTPFDLPESVMGYDAVDAVVWLDADSNNLTTGGSRRLAALTDYVRNGGRFIVCQAPERFKLENLADLLPVETKNSNGDWVIDIRDKADLEPIRSIAKYRTNSFGDAAEQLRVQQNYDWDKVQKRGPFKVAFAKLRDGAVGEQWMDWKGDGSEVSPWIARRALGMGSVTWVAQDLGNRTITGRDASGWSYVWDVVLGQRNIDMRSPNETDGDAKYAQEARARYATSNAVDLGASLLDAMNHEGRAGGLMFLAGVFFVGYWVVAGPVAYFVLLGKKRTELSWTIFAASALAATLLTVGVVRLVLRGDASVHHLTLVRMIADGRSDDGSMPMSRAIIDSRIGLYIPRDYSNPGQGAPVALEGNDKNALSYVTPFSIHPAHNPSSTDFPAYLEYDVPVRDAPLTEQVLVKVPYRSTLKKLQAHWVGRVEGGVEVAVGKAGGFDASKPKLLPLGNKRTGQRGTISGLLTNKTGVGLAHVYFVFNYPPLFEGGRMVDQILSMPTWKNGETKDLGYEWVNSFGLPSGTVGEKNVATPGGGNLYAISGFIVGYTGLGASDWAMFWYSGLHASTMNDQFNDARSEYVRAFPMLSLFQRVAPAQNVTGTDRVEVLRRNAREFDVSDLVAAGQLVILATAGAPGAIDHSPLPYPLDAEGDRMLGSGTTFYQFAMPLDRSELPKPYTKVEGDEKPATTTTTTPEDKTTTTSKP